MAKQSEVATDLGALGGKELLLDERVATFAPPPPSAHDDPGLARYIRSFERLRELVAKANSDLYSREVVYGFPLLIGALPNPKGRGFRAICSPLFLQTVSVAAEPDGSLSLRAIDEPPRFNTSLWQGICTASQLQSIMAFGHAAQEDLAAEYSVERVRQLLEALRSVLPFVDSEFDDDELLAWPAPEKSPSASHLTAFSGATAFLTNRSSLYLLNDLEQIRRDPASFLTDDESPLALLTQRPSNEAREDLRSPREDEVVFPFASNAPQRRVADALDKNRLVVVQGPPGTGKSQTIANLVAHLVANGQRVLVTSHKQQALTVVRDKLSAIRTPSSDQPLRFLFAALIGSDGAAKQALRRDIQSVGAFAAKANIDELSKQLKQIEKRRRTNADAFAAAEDDFESRALDDQAEAASLWEFFGGAPTPPIADPVVPIDQQQAVVDALTRLDTLTREFSQGLFTLAEWGVDPSGDLAPLGRGLAAFIDHQTLRIEVADTPGVMGLVDQWRPIAERSGPSSLESAATTLDVVVSVFQPALERVSGGGADEVSARSSARQLADLPELIPPTESDLASLEALLDGVRGLASTRDAVPAEALHRATIATQHDASLNGGLFARRKALRWLDENAPGVRGLTAETVGSWRAFWDGWTEVRSRLAALGAGLSNDPGELYAPDTATKALANAQRAVALANAIIEMRTAASKTPLPIPLERMLNATSAPAVQEAAHDWTLALRALRADAQGGALIADRAMLHPRDALRAIDAAADDGRFDEVAQGVGRLRPAAEAIQAYRECHDLRTGPLSIVPASAALVTSAAHAGEDPPSFLRDGVASYERHESAHAFRELALRDDTEVVARRAQDARGKVIDDAAATLEIRIQARIMEAFKKPSFQASLKAFNKAMNASAKRVETFEALKTSPEVDPNIITDAFPCWIMRPDDACRIFRLAPNTFDVVIFDEASQCNPDMALPLFARANKVVVFGDDKQLSNEDLKLTLSVAQNEGLKRQAGLEPLDPTGLFDELNASLLELVGHRQQAQVLLDEHFRCRPEIVAFSNRQFYGDTLRVIRDRDDSKGLGPPILVRHVDGGPWVGKAKINHAEADALIDDLIARLDEPAYSGMSFGVLSLFRDQIDYIREQVALRVASATAVEHQLICATVDGFQGDERDVIYYSWRFAHGASSSIFSFTQGTSGSQRVNVALTRARHQMIHFISRPVSDFPTGQTNVTGFLNHAMEPNAMLAEVEGRFFAEPSNRTRELLRGALEASGLEVEEDFPIAGTRLDLLVRDPQSNARIGVFCDAQGAALRPADAPTRIASHALLARAGWTLRRAPATEVLQNHEEVVANIKADLAGSEGNIGTPELDTPPHFARIDITLSGDPAPDSAPSPADLAPEDLATYPWLPPSADRRIADGDVVFMSNFERDLFNEVDVNPDLHCVPQWPTCGKYIDLVITDRAGRRIAIEADGDAFHHTETGELIPEDRLREETLVRAGWRIHRISFTAWERDRDHEIKQALVALSNCEPNPLLAEAVWEADVPDREPTALAALVDGQTASSKAAEDALSTPGPSRAEPQPSGEPLELIPTPTQIRLELQSDADEASSHGGAPPVHLPDDDAGAGHPFEQVDLGEVPKLASELVARTTGIGHEDLINSVAAELGTPDLPKNYRRLVSSLVWSAAGRKFIMQDGTRWVEGPETPAADETLTRWSLSRIAREAGALGGDRKDDEKRFAAMCELLSAGKGRVGKPAARAIGMGLRLSERDA